MNYILKKLDRENFEDYFNIWIDDIFVLPEYRGKGIGKKIFLECIGEAKKRGCGRAEWLAFGEGPRPFYESFGAKMIKDDAHYRMTEDQFDRILGNETCQN